MGCWRRPAGKHEPEIRVYDADSGDALATYTFPETADWFINDLVVTRRAVYATDSRNRELLVVGSCPTEGSPAREATSILPLTGDFDVQAGTGLNGIVASRGRLIAIQGATSACCSASTRRRAPPGPSTSVGTGSSTVTVSSSTVTSCTPCRTGSTWSPWSTWIDT